MVKTVTYDDWQETPELDPDTEFDLKVKAIADEILTYQARINDVDRQIVTLNEKREVLSDEKSKAYEKYFILLDNLNVRVKNVLADAFKKRTEPILLHFVGDPVSKTTLSPDRPIRIRVNNDGKFEIRKWYILGTYDSVKECKKVITDLADAIKHGDSAFTFGGQNA